ncbi:hypothetical protein GCM10022386_01660 [Flavobacterium cheonhonense]|uniref:Uncharacterized protein n=2 Tax=Flavobacterium cheonhonense TaxID=706185 RepID=A0ABP7T807_9FLAO
MPNLISPTELEYQSLIDDYFNYYLQFNLVHIHETVRILEANDLHYKYLKLENQQSELLSVVRLKTVIFYDQKFYCINKSKSIILNQGYATLLYEYCFNNLNRPIISDSVQTKGGSSDLWHKLISKDRDYQIFKYYTNTNKYVELKNGYNPYLVWGIENAQILAETPAYVYEDLDYDVNFEKSEIDEVFELDYPNLSLSTDYIDPKLIQFIEGGKIKDRYHVRLVVK